ncbi:WD40-like repeat-containing protein [Thermoplasmatales archaeon SCGC AB-539-N05]|nr:WD40-like repeat-containing protein [Thermoplasmatales archaeon SCGC AB-539-N05]
MQKKWIFRRSLIITIVLMLLAVSFFPISIVSSSYVMNEEDGTWMDAFIDDAGISEKGSIVVERGSVKIATGLSYPKYDFTKKNFSSGSAAFQRDNVFTIPPSYLSSGDLPFFESVLPILKDYEFSEDDYAKISADDDERVEKTALTGMHAVHHFVFKVDEPRKDIETILIRWVGHASDGIVKLFVWNYTKDAKTDYEHWDETAETSNDEDDEVLSTLTDINSYVNTKGYMHIVIESEKSRSKLLGNTTKTLYTNFIRLEVTARTYQEKGYLTSVAIEPGEGNLSRWGLFAWNDRKFRGTNINYRVYRPGSLVGSKELIPDTEIPGNSDGFSESPVDLSGIKDTDAIYLNATLSASEGGVFTPLLYDWGVTWQRENDEWVDSFSTSYRTAQRSDTTVENSTVRIGDLITDWPMFGRNLTNQRVAEGYGPEGNILLWRTGTQVAGKFCSPVISDGVLYIASEENKKITARDTTDGGIGGTVFWSTTPVDGIFAGTPTVTDTLVILGTCKGGEVNKVYAFDKTTGEQVWDPFQYDSSTPFCFYSSPVVHDGKVFIVGSERVSKAYPLLGIENDIFKLFALNEDDGGLLWSTNLPAASFGSPAIYDGVIYVGCANSNGSSLLAISENDGSIIQESNVGAIGRSSPVVYDGKIFVTVMKEESTSVPATASAKIIMVNVSDITEVVWEKNLGEINTLKWTKLLLSLLGVDFLYLIPDNAVASSTPVVHNDVIFVGSSDGKLYALNVTTGDEIWSPFEMSGDYLFSSPAIAEDTVYIVSYDGTLYAVRGADGKEIWSYKTPSTTFITASPVIVDGVVYFSDDEGRVYAVGSYKKKINIEGSVISALLKPPVGMWWHRFYASIELNGGKVAYSLLDENYEVLKEEVHNEDDISSLKSNKIRLCAKLVRDSQLQNPHLLDWSVTFKDEIDLPDGWTDRQPEGWTNVATPTVSVYVKDSTSGLDSTTAQYSISYSIYAAGNMTQDDISLTIELLNLAEPDLFGKIVYQESLVPGILPGRYYLYIPWNNASCECSEDLKTGLIIAENVPIVEDKLRDILPMKTFRDYFGEYITNYTIAVNGVEFCISDLAGNQNHSETYKIDVDTTDPSSFLLDGGWYNGLPLDLTAYAEDDESGVAGVWLYYRYSENNQSWPENWTLYGDAEIEEDVWSWLFDPDEGDGYYELYTEAVDSASNEENISEDTIVLLIIDTKLPTVNYPDIHWFNETAPLITFSFTDNMKVKEAYYKIGKSGEYKLIDEDIDEQTVNLTLSLEGEWDSFTAGNKSYLYFKVTDYAGNVYETADAGGFMIVKDIYPPYSEVDQIHTAWYYLVPFTVMAGTYDDDSPIKNVTLYYRRSNDNETWNNWTIFGTDEQSPFEWSFDAPKGSGYYEFYSYAVDSAGNKEEMPVSSTVADASTGVNCIPVLLVIVMLILGILVIMVVIVSSLKIRVKK